MGQWGSRLSACSRLPEVLEARHCWENPDAMRTLDGFFDSASLLCTETLLDLGGRGMSDEVNSLNQTSLCN